MREVFHRLLILVLVAIVAFGVGAVTPKVCPFVAKSLGYVQVCCPCCDHKDDCCKDGCCGGKCKLDHKKACPCKCGCENGKPCDCLDDCKCSCGCKDGLKCICKEKAKCKGCCE